MRPVRDVTYWRMMPNLPLILGPNGSFLTIEVRAARWRIGHKILGNGGNSRGGLSFYETGQNVPS